jgi:uncharacterized membrane protein YgcG
MRSALADVARNGSRRAGAATGEVGAAAATERPSALTTWAYEALIACLQLIGEGLVFLIRWMSRILTATLFILGPLALVASIPRVSGTGTRWFHRYVTIASWPVFSGVLLSVMVTLDAQGAARGSYLECLVAALVMLVTALSTPTLASHVVGGALQNFAATGFGTASTTRREGVAPAARGVAVLAGGVKGRVVAASASIAGRLTGGGRGSGDGGGATGGGRSPGSGAAPAGGAGRGGVTANVPGSPGQIPRSRGGVHPGNDPDPSKGGSHIP